jgi:4-hydroxy-tetrahydrodipicolinate reductase
MAATKVAVCGAAGRMGRRIIALTHEDAAATVSGALEATGNPTLGSDAGELAGVGNLGISVTDDFSSLCTPGNVIVDFSTADATVEHVRTAAASGNAIVVGASGFSAEQRAEMEGLADRLPILIAANMSLGVTVLTTLVEDAIARLGSGFDCEIVEIHHNRKKDSPSGTALALGEAAAKARNLDPAKALVLAREGMVGENIPSCSSAPESELSSSTVLLRVTPLHPEPSPLPSGSTGNRTVCTPCATLRDSSKRGQKSLIAASVSGSGTPQVAPRSRHICVNSAAPLSSPANSGSCVVTLYGCHAQTQPVHGSKHGTDRLYRGWLQYGRSARELPESHRSHRRAA